MLNVLKRWVDRYFSNEEAMVLVLLLAALLAIVLFFGEVLAPFMTALVFAYLLQGAMHYFKRRGLSHLLATVVVFSLFLTLMLTLVLIIMPAIWKQMIQFLYEVPRMAAEGQEFLLLLPEQYPDLFTVAQVEQWTKQIGDELASLGQYVVSFSITGITGVMGILIYCVLVPILVFFLLKDSQQIMSWCIRFLPARRQLIDNVWSEMNVQIANYIRGKALEIVIVGSVSYLAFVIMGLNYAALLALSVGISVLIPYIGAAIVTIPVAMVAYMQWGWSNDFTYLLVVYGIIQALDGNVLVPLLFSEVVNLHPVAIIVAVLLFGGLWGFWGVFFAIPLATLFKAVLAAWPESSRSLESSAAIES